MATSRWAGVLAAAAVVGIAGCGPVRAPEAAGSASPAAGTTDRSASSSSPSAGPSAGPTAAAPAGPVPAGFAATSVTWVSPDEAFVLGTAPCADAPCTSIARTLNRGASWTALPAPAVPVGAPGQAGVVWGIRFATPEHGFVFGDGLWETTDGGQRWSRVRTPNGLVLSLAIVPGQVLALVAPCPPGGCPRYGFLASRPLSGGIWTGVANGAATRLIDPDDLIATQAGVAAAVAGADVIVLRPHRPGHAVNPIPCPSPAQTPSVAVISATGLVAIATESAASWLFYSGAGGAAWRIVSQHDDGGAGWADLGFTTATDGVVVYGPADSDGNSTQRPGQLMLTDDAGATWYRVRF
jgi:hypothetical protein